MRDGPDGRVPQRKRPPDSIWERYLMGKLSLEDKETLPALVKELHQEIAQHLGENVDAEQPLRVEPAGLELPVTPPTAPTLTPMIDAVARSSLLKKRRPVDPTQN